MPWHIGIDEAGYGPNLGPFVMTLVACQTPDDRDLWEVMKSCVRRADEPADDRMIVADSKQVYAPASGDARQSQAPVIIRAAPRVGRRRARGGGGGSRPPVRARRTPPTLRPP